MFYLLFKTTTFDTSMLLCFDRIYNETMKDHGGL